MNLSPLRLKAFENDGFIAPIRLISRDQARLLRGIGENLLSESDQCARYELTDPIRFHAVTDSEGWTEFSYDPDQESSPHTFGFLFNVWKINESFRRVAFSREIADIARELLGSQRILLMEDNVVMKAPGTKRLPWHQDYSYWPLSEPAAVTAWIALEDIDASNGSMEVAPGTQNLGERLPVWFGDGTSFMHQYRPGIPDVPQNVHEKGPTSIYKLSPGEGGFHHSLLWHGSTANESDQARYAYVLRYVTEGTVWLGSRRFPYDDIGCAPGEPLTTDHFPIV